MSAKKRFLKNKSKKTLYKGYFIINTFLFLFTCVYSNLFLLLQKKDTAFTLWIQISMILIYSLLVMPVCNNLVSFSLSRKLNFYKKHEASDHQKELLIRKLKSFPTVKTIIDHIIYVSFQLLLFFCYYFFYQFDIKYITVNFIVELNVIYFASLIVFRYTEAHTKKIIASIMNELQEKRQYERVSDSVNSLKSLFFFFIAMPLILSAFSIAAILVLKTSSLFCLICAGVLNFIILSFSAFLFIYELNMYLFKMGKALTAISIGRITGIRLFPLDLNTEISHTLYLLNKIIIIFKNLHKKTDSAATQINLSKEELIHISFEAEKIMSFQKNSISKTIKNMNQAEKILENTNQNIFEISNTAKTMYSTSQKDYLDFSLSMKKIQEISNSNHNTLRQIEELTSKINSIHEIITLINSLAEQTKIIALNAELVANSVNNEKSDINNISFKIRELSDNVIKIANETKEDIHQIQLSRQKLLERGEKTIEKINESSLLTKKLLSYFSDINNFAEKNVKDTEEVKEYITNQKESFKNLIESITKCSIYLDDFEETAKVILKTINILNKTSSNIKNMNFNIKEKI